MKLALIIFSFFIIAAILLFIVLGIMSRSGEAPGLVNGLLSKCSNKPNCVCSEYKEDETHYIEPILIPKKHAFDVLTIVKKITQEMGGHIQTESDHYLASTFSSALFGFVDDVEMRIDMEKHLIQLRSASRVGYSDRGVNKARAEQLKKRFNTQFSVNK